MLAKTVTAIPRDFRSAGIRGTAGPGDDVAHEPEAIAADDAKESRRGERLSTLQSPMRKWPSYFAAETMDDRRETSRPKARDCTLGGAGPCLVALAWSSQALLIRGATRPCRRSWARRHACAVADLADGVVGDLPGPIAIRPCRAAGGMATLGPGRGACQRPGGRRIGAIATCATGGCAFSRRQRNSWDRSCRAAA